MLAKLSKDIYEVICIIHYTELFFIQVLANKQQLKRPRGWLVVVSGQSLPLVTKFIYKQESECTVCPLLSSNRNEKILALRIFMDFTKVTNFS